MKNHPKDYHLKLDVEAKTNEKKGLYIYPIVHCNACRSCITRHDVEGDKLKYADGTHTAVHAAVKDDSYECCTCCHQTPMNWIFLRSSCTVPDIVGSVHFLRAYLVLMLNSKHHSSHLGLILAVGSVWQKYYPAAKYITKMPSTNPQLHYWHGPLKDRGKGSFGPYLGLINAYFVKGQIKKTTMASLEK